MFKILSTASALPKCRKTNDDLSTFLDTSDEWISQRTGIRERAVCTDETLTDLLTQAASQALERAGITAQELDLILCATIRGDYTHHLRRVLIQKETVQVVRRWISVQHVRDLLCSGCGSRIFCKKESKKSSGTCRRLYDQNDGLERSFHLCTVWRRSRSSCLGEGENLMAIQLTANGNVDVLNIPHVGGDSPFDKLPKNQSYLSMNGKEVYKFAVSSMYRDVQTVCDQAGVKVEDVDWIVPHQANLRIIEAAAHKLKVSGEKCLTRLKIWEIPQLPSIPIVLDRANTEWQV